jgi:hypothetical protein
MNQTEPSPTAALTPRVWLMAVCDRVRESTTEGGVYHLRGVRQIKELLPLVDTAGPLDEETDEQMPRVEQLRDAVPQCLGPALPP